MFSGEVCQTCGEPATGGCVDLLETEPVKDENGQAWRTWKIDGEPRYYCAAHPAPSFKRYLDGRVEEDLPTRLATS